jgi:hypothetical protein
MEAWRARAATMHAAGMSVYSIAKELHLSVSKIGLAVEPDKYRPAAAERNRKRQEQLKSERPKHYFGGVEIREPRQPKQILDPAVRDEAVRLFAAGKINRAELSRRLRNGATS